MGSEECSLTNCAAFYLAEIGFRAQFCHSTDHHTRKQLVKIRPGVEFARGAWPIGHDRDVKSKVTIASFRLGCVSKLKEKKHGWCQIMYYTIKSNSVGIRIRVND